MTVERAALSSPRRRGPAKGDLKEQAILETCERLLSDRPLSDITVDELAAGAGISRPSFYFYFESKDALLRALVEGIADEMYRESERWLERSDDPPAEIALRSFEASARLWHEHGPVLRAANRGLGCRPRDAGLLGGHDRALRGAVGAHHPRRAQSRATRPAARTRRRSRRRSSG